MNFNKRLIIQFIMQHVFVLVTLLIAVVAAFTYLIFLLTSTLYEPNIPDSDSFTISRYISSEDEHISLQSEVQDLIKEKNDWLQVVDENGKILYHFNTPNDVPNAYTKTSLVAYIQHHIESNYKFTYWEIELEEKKVLVIYGGMLKSNALLTAIQKDHSSLTMDSFALTDQEKQLLSKEKATLQIFNQNGEEVFSYPTGKKKTFSAIQIALNEKEPWNHKENTSSFYDANSGNLLVVTAKNEHYYPDDEIEDVFTKKFLIGCGLILLIVFVYLVILSIWYGNKFGKPLLHAMRWLKNIAGGKYEEPISKKGKPVRFRRSGKEKWSFRLFRDVTSSLEHLSITLKKNDAMRQVLQQTREEWITGLTHDLKTPLSSIYGYALLLESNQYNWTDRDIQQFGSVMKEKSQYMTTLIDDLSLTYQLKNNSLPAQHVNVEINQFVQKVLLQFINNPTLQNQNIEFVPSSNKIQYFIEEKWFQRIIENLLVNAVKHNNETTTVIVKLSQNANSFTLSISDDGKGMDEKTKELLFERYYRGTNTEESNIGTGLGLAITKQLVHAHNGTISVDSALGKGTTIILVFPFRS
ncbi:two-component sensor histidine kinase [Bacillus thuringiensis serovar andalousiensis]|uniref:histidine kinase n=1 Tax=Bacillus thuringiensis TaxID=1428 RepID=A0A9X6KDZ0_BACTU|nr:MULTISPECIES: HAMP domain-containing sensor histidine kinase [Bacillus cereus group]MDA2610922.1 HAMP domain-containing sensor histidine kinase [Bacillus cereus]MDR5044672.1 HAMP domain-containing histidine kinase [Bacillus thuringiensis]MEB8552657.1 HAMP domain-containing sensor histidine kinase [Bacillus cereus]MEB8647724.1 HAMP domain-containing sensor histidine kinase [Bacillus cereus]MEB8669278.1 HAMP domain-containing sensor histidine kinase [Bacillus cereus]